jgi:hypothetical protein
VISGVGIARREPVRAMRVEAEAEGRSGGFVAVDVVVVPREGGIMPAARRSERVDSTWESLLLREWRSLGESE